MINHQASGSESQFVKVFDTSGNLLSNIRSYDGFLGQRLSPIQTLSFHPHKVLLAAAGSDQLISLYGH
jgi:regulator-associated protein of mTOR